MALILRSIATTFVLAGTLILAGTAGAAEGKHAGMVLIPAGEFTMGREGGPPGEGPTHKLFLSAFFIDRNLVTMKQYSKFIQAKGHIGPKGEQYLDVADEDNRIHRPGDTWQAEPGWEDYPASEMAWHGAVAYCKWLDKQLVSEAEWEKAARGTDGRLYPWGNGPPTPELAFFGSYRGDSVPVGRYPKGRSPYGVLGHGRPDLGVDPVHRNAVSLRPQGRPGGSVGAVPEGGPGRQRRQRSRGAHRHFPPHRGPRQDGKGPRVLRLSLRLQGRDGAVINKPPAIC